MSRGVHVILLLSCNQGLRGDLTVSVLTPDQAVLV